MRETERYSFVRLKGFESHMFDFMSISFLIFSNVSLMIFFLLLFVVHCVGCSSVHFLIEQFIFIIRSKCSGVIVWFLWSLRTTSIHFISLPFFHRILWLHGFSQSIGLFRLYFDSFIGLSNITRILLHDFVGLWFCDEVCWSDIWLYLMESNSNYS